jgi:hypothetical protein
MIEQLVGEAASVMVSDAEEKDAHIALLDVQFACRQPFGSIGVRRRIAGLDHFGGGEADILAEAGSEPGHSSPAFRFPRH